MPPAAHTPRRLRVVVLLGGTATMALQMAAVRLIAPAVGASSIVWATIIGLSLLAMSLGYVLGGRLADRRVDGRTLALTLGVAALLVATIPLVAPALLDHVTLGLADPTWADLIGAAIAYAVLVLAPALLLGVTPPYAIRLSLGDVSDTGHVAGGLYALSTVGSIIGTLGAALVLVQWVGTRWTLWVIAIILLAAAAIARNVRPEQALGDTPATPSEPAHAPARTRTGEAAVIPLALAGTIVLVEGMAMMATEMSIARLVAPFFGASHAVWAIIIATVMGSIALGSRIGGRCADRWPTLGALVSLLALAAAAVAVLPFVTSPVMRLSTGGIDNVEIGVVVGTFLGTMALLVVPVTLLGMVPPWVLRLTVPSVASAGRTAGRMYALSTVGAIVGTFASVLWLIPAIGTRRTMLLFAGALALLATGIWIRRLPKVGRRSTLLAPASLVVVILLSFAPTGLVKPLDDGKVLDERESRYQFIQTVEDGDRHLLQLNEGWAVHSIWDPDTVLTGGIWDHFLVVPALRNRPDESRHETTMLVIGSAAGTTKRAFDALRPTVDMTSVELDTEVTKVGRKHFELTGDVEAFDGRPFLERSDDEWDVIHIDAYRQPYIPFYLTTREFFELAKAHLTDGGVVSINVGSSPDDPRINEAVAATMRDVFPIVARGRAAK
jgi:predicted membrane-bound spermidine synthase